VAAGDLVAGLLLVALALLHALDPVGDGLVRAARRSDAVAAAAAAAAATAAAAVRRRSRASDPTAVTAFDEPSVHKYVGQPMD